MASIRAPKQWALTKQETKTSFDAWRQNLQYILSLDPNVAAFVHEDTTWLRNTSSSPLLWQAVRAHYGFQSTGAHFLDFNNIRLEPDERPEDLYQRILSFIDDSLLKANDNIQHHGENVSADEQLSPTLENMIVLNWLRLIHTDLPALVKQRYGTELRSKTLASLKPEISQALDSLLEEIESMTLRSSELLFNDQASAICYQSRQTQRYAKELPTM